MRLALAFAGLAFGLSAVSAQADVIADRKAAMKRLGFATRTGSVMVRSGQFDRATAQEVFTTYREVAGTFGGLFPASSASGDTTAAPKLWQDRAGFEAELAAFAADAAKGAAATDLASFRAAFSQTGDHCFSCHEAYRIRR